MTGPNPADQSRQRDPSDLLTGRVLAAALLAVVVFGSVPQPAHAQQAAAQDKTEGPSKNDVVVLGQRPAAPCSPTASQPVDYACLNGELKTAAQAAQPAPSAADVVTGEANTPSRVGTFSHTATSQRMGRNFGHSAQPYRPSAPVYTNPAAGRPPR